jgi:hypothetical protein
MELAEMDGIFSYTSSYELPDPDRQFWIRIRIRKKGPDPVGSGSATLPAAKAYWLWRVLSNNVLN